MRTYAYPRNVRVLVVGLFASIYAGSLLFLTGYAVLLTMSLSRGEWAPLSEFFEVPIAENFLVPGRLFFASVCALLWLLPASGGAALLYWLWRSVSITCAMNGKTLTLTRPGKSVTIDLAAVTSVKATWTGRLVLQTHEGVLHLPLALENSRDLVESLKVALDERGTVFGASRYHKAVDEAVFRAWFNENYCFMTCVFLAVLGATIVFALFFGAYVRFNPLAHWLLILAAATCSFAFYAGPYLYARPRFHGAWRADWAKPDAACARGALFWSVASVVIALVLAIVIICSLVA